MGDRALPVSTTPRRPGSGNLLRISRFDIYRSTYRNHDQVEI